MEAIRFFVEELTSSTCFLFQKQITNLQNLHI